MKLKFLASPAPTGFVRGKEKREKTNSRELVNSELNPSESISKRPRDGGDSISGFDRVRLMGMDAGALICMLFARVVLHRRAKRVRGGASACAVRARWSGRGQALRGRERAVVQAPRCERMACAGDPRARGLRRRRAVFLKGVEGSFRPYGPRPKRVPV